MPKNCFGVETTKLSRFWLINFMLQGETMLLEHGLLIRGILYTSWIACFFPTLGIDICTCCRYSWSILLYSSTSTPSPLGIDIGVGPKNTYEGYLLWSCLSQTHIHHVRDYLIHQIGWGFILVPYWIKI